MRLIRSHPRRAPAVAFAILTLFAAAAATQTRITPPPNKYTPAQDIELGRQAATEAERQLPILRDEAVQSYVEHIGRQLVDAVPPELQHPEFRYSFQVVNVRDINAFALPGGPMFVNRGMIEAARTEGEVAGVMAHELSHVVLRHGTAQATKAQNYALGELAGAILGSIVGGRVGGVIAEGSRFGIGTAFLRFSREYERQADLLGVQTMARAGYDPLDLAHMFETIERQSGRGGPQWLSDHPNPGNRIGYIEEEARSVRIENPVHDAKEFRDVQARLGAMSPAPTTEDAMRGGGRRSGVPPGGSAPEARRRNAHVDLPSSRFVTYDEGDLFRVSVPDNWRELPGNSSVKFAPLGAYGQYSGRDVFTHGIEIGLTRNELHNLEQATQEFVDALGQGNPDLRQQGDIQRTEVGDRSGLIARLLNVSQVTGQSEVVTVRTALLRDGNLFYVISVAPDDEYRAYQEAFQRVARSIELYDR